MLGYGFLGFIGQFHGYVYATRFMCPPLFQMDLLEAKWDRYLNNHSLTVQMRLGHWDFKEKAVRPDTLLWSEILLSLTIHYFKHAT